MSHSSATNENIELTGRCGGCGCIALIIGIILFIASLTEAKSPVAFSILISLGISIALLSICCFYMCYYFWRTRPRNPTHTPLSDEALRINIANLRNIFGPIEGRGSLSVTTNMPESRSENQSPNNSPPNVTYEDSVNDDMKNVQDNR